VATTIKKSAQIREVLQEACSRKEMLILVTPYLRFESGFVGLEKDALHVLATMSREDAVYGLKTPGLKLRFPHGLGFFEAKVDLIGLGMLGQRRTLKLSIPSSLEENDQRVAFRVERVGRVSVTFSTPRPDLYSANLSDISVSGARIHCQEDIPSEKLRVGDALAITIPLVEGLHINGHGIVRHSKGRSFGVEFHPPLPKDVLDPLSRWVFQNREEERERLARKLELGLGLARPFGPPLPVRGVLLVSSDEGLEAQLREGVPVANPLGRIPPTAQGVRESLLSQPALVILHLKALNLDERRRMKALAEILQGRCPVLLLGTDVEGALLYELATEWRASSALVWSAQRGAFFQRLVQGIIRRHQEGGDSPMAPQEVDLA
jgi:hypothetical protein